MFRSNSFAAPQVRIQADRGQTVATTGPYRIVRHPMYAAAILYFLGVPLLLGSLWALLPVPLFVVAFAARAVGEERMLRQSLPGYDAYADNGPDSGFIPGTSGDSQAFTIGQALSDSGRNASSAGVVPISLYRSHSCLLSDGLLDLEQIGRMDLAAVLADLARAEAVVVGRHRLHAGHRLRAARPWPAPPPCPCTVFR